MTFAILLAKRVPTGRDCGKTLEAGLALRNLAQRVKGGGKAPVNPSVVLSP